MTTTNAIDDYHRQAREFLERARAYLADGDLHQTSEKGWGAAAHMVKAVAAAIDRPYAHHAAFRQIIRHVAPSTGDRRGLVTLSHSAEILHSNYYERRRFLDADDIAADLDDVAEMIERLAAFIEG